MKRVFRASLYLAIAAALAASACGTSDDSSGTGGGGSGGGGSGGSGGGLVCEGAPVPCEDTMIQEMQLVDTVAPGQVGINEAVDGTWVSHVDATAGGFGANPPHAFVYARFTDAGLEKVEITDEEALESADWDIAFRRYLIRINSGDSGPSCVTAARMAPGTSFETAAGPTDEAAWRRDDFYTETCEFMNDGSGLPGSPATALASFYTYTGCVKMTGNVYVIRTADGRMAKFTVDAYYGENQETCQTDDTPPAGGSGNVIVRWAFLE